MPYDRPYHDRHCPNQTMSARNPRSPAAIFPTISSNSFSSRPQATEWKRLVQAILWAPWGVISGTGVTAPLNNFIAKSLDHQRAAEPASEIQLSRIHGTKLVRFLLACGLWRSNPLNRRRHLNTDASSLLEKALLPAVWGSHWTKPTSARILTSANSSRRRAARPPVPQGCRCGFGDIGLFGNQLILAGNSIRVQTATKHSISLVITQAIAGSWRRQLAGLGCLPGTGHPINDTEDRRSDKQHGQDRRIRPQLGPSRPPTLGFYKMHISETSMHQFKLHGLAHQSHRSHRSHLVRKKHPSGHNHQGLLHLSISLWPGAWGYRALFVRRQCC
ncbi:hypothetical protein QBC44DRAFT_42171 [Cladorrhinum sp. PSN332]|nr:hypothetical protein QBC44DRAFT_42171 [Cladorrhinum sp. PSN332]